MFFEDSDDDRQGEVRISTSEEREKREKGEESRLKQEAESKLTDSSKSLTSTSSDVSLKDVHRQNERIIELLEEISDESSTSSKDKSQELGGGAAADGLL